MRVNPSTWLIGYAAVLVAFGLFDGMWLGLIAMPWYQEAFSTLLREDFVTWPWILFYLGYGAAVMYLAILPSLGQPISHPFLAGAVLGATAYGTYNLTGYSTIAGWPLEMALIDWTWGTGPTALVALAGSAATRSVHKRNRS
ncbi:DUF2177 family protein [Alteromonas sp. ASW11-130]|uniref:DUF2177 family protein n=1 Tax=Alteromonas sp. ASW11-130 TaxID=3015775 RepID=UPI0022428192|nr:DUF2177 family protein [Alteromonas sp. ASW11-130]MCW8093343.1 DUF2177 family protein [Alteromonas sp. ASW11-130]